MLWDWKVMSASLPTEYLSAGRRDSMALRRRGVSDRGLKSGLERSDGAVNQREGCGQVAQGQGVELVIGPARRRDELAKPCSDVRGDQVHHLASQRHAERREMAKLQDCYATLDEIYTYPEKLCDSNSKISDDVKSDRNIYGPHPFERLLPALPLLLHRPRRG